MSHVNVLTSEGQLITLKHVTVSPQPSHNRAHLNPKNMQTIQTRETDKLVSMSRLYLWGRRERALAQMSGRQGRKLGEQFDRMKLLK